MTTITGFTADRMRQIEKESIVDARLDGYNLILINRDGDEFDVGTIRGPMGPTGTISGAPTDGKTHAIKDGNWVPVTGEAPEDGGLYVRRNGSWVRDPKGGLIVPPVVSTVDTAYTTTTERTFVTLSLPSNFPGGRRVRLACYISRTGGTVQNDIARLRMKEGASILQEFMSPQVLYNTGLTNGPGVLMEAHIIPTPGAHTYTLTIARFSGTGQVKLAHLANAPTYFTATDEGPA